MPFAGSHYSALVRLYHAMLCRNQVNQLCDALAEGAKGSEAELVLSAHLASASFWESIGSCIDNLALAFEDAPPLDFLGSKSEDEEAEGKTGRKYLKKRHTELSEAYDRRTQFIHSRLIPHRLEDKLLTFNVRLLQSKDTNWPSKHGVQEEFVQDFHDDSWHEIVNALGDAWNHLHNWMLNKSDGQRESQHGPLTLPDIDFSQIKPGDIQIEGGPIPPSNVVWPPNSFGGPPPSGTR